MPAAVAADMLTSVWDQNAGLYVAGPAAAVVEEVCRSWLTELLGLPEHVSVAYVTGCQMAHVTALAAARHHVLEQAGWDVEANGLAGAPPVRVLVGEKRHATFRALRLLGIGAASLVLVTADDQGRMRVDALRAALGAGSGPTIVCAQAGEVNTGAFDPLDEIADAAEEARAWFHVDGAFGLWAAAVPGLRHLVRGSERADSWATDCHKWLNVPYDSGLAICAHPDAHRAAIGVTRRVSRPRRGPARARPGGLDAGVLATGARLPRLRGAPLARHGRALPIWSTAAARTRAGSPRSSKPAGADIVNEVVLNQVLVRFGDGERTRAVIAAVQDDGTCWLGGTDWDGRARDADLRLELAHDRGRRRPLDSGDLARRLGRPQVSRT